ncbi:hypothetical protein [Planctomicrobium sp. SH527]|uniref:hypothetical protein n=1 Tax=Planctomicrobium sp. SH527 TaxID=3448123 RepID=UPI003F5B75ED
MADRRYIPRPRHLFPETAAFFIRLRRAALYLGFGSRAFIGHIPAWIAGASAGVAAFMLAASLFWLRDEVQAAPLVQKPALPAFQPSITTTIPVTQTQPTKTIPTAPVMTPQVPLTPQRKPVQLSIKLEQTNFPFPFDELHNSVTSSSELKPQIPTQLAIRDLWRLAGQRAVITQPFSSYIASANGLPLIWGMLVASETVPLQLAPDASRGMGILVKKTEINSCVVGEPVSYEISLVNMSDKPIEQLMVREKISDLQRVTQVLPSASVSDNELVWTMTSFEPGSVKTMRITLIPEVEGPIVTETRVLPASRISRTVNVRPRPVQPAPVAPQLEPTPDQGAPELKLTYTSIPALKQGDNLSMTFSISNVGTAPATDVCLYVRLSGEFEHRYGEYVQHRIPVIEPGQTRRALLQATARDAGHARLSASLTMKNWEVLGRELRVPITPELTASRSSGTVVNRTLQESEFQPVSGSR